MGKETGLPKNIRQIGEVQGEEKICLEDYVMTCIHKKEPQEKDGYLGIFYGEQQKAEDGVYVFIRGILEVPAGDGEEQIREHLEEQQRTYFPDWEVQGCCVIGQYPTERMKQIETAVPNSVRLIYHLQEQEENVYWTMDGRYKKMKGHFIFYEQNRRMQQYLADQFQEDSVEKESLPDRAIKSFREKVREKSGERSSSMLKMASSFFVVTVLVIGAIAVTRIDDIRKVRNAFDRNGSTAENEAADEQGQIYLSTSGGGIASPAGSEQIQGGNGTASGALVQASGGASDGQLQIPAASQDLDGGAAADSSAVIENGSVAIDGVAVEDGVADGSAVTENGLAGIDGAPVEDGVAADGSAVTEKGLAGIDGAAAEDGAAADSSAVIENGLAGSGGLPAEDGTAADSGAVTENSPTNSGAVTENSPIDSSAAPSSMQEAGDAAVSASSASVRITRASYTIREGDTLADICNKYYGSLDKLDAICQANSITDANVIMPGDKIVLP